MSIASLFIPRIIAIAHSPYNKTISVIERFGKKELYVNGIQQSGPYTVRLWKAGLKNFFDTSPHDTNSILVMGVGGGTVFPMLRKEFPKSTMTGVDVDSEIIRLYKTYFQSPQENTLHLISSDAQTYIKNIIVKQGRYDIVIIDLYVGNDVPEFASGNEFLGSVKKILAPHGTVIFNYFSASDGNHMSGLLFDKLSTIYQSVDRQRVLRNTFFYCT